MRSISRPKGRSASRRGAGASQRGCPSPPPITRNSPIMSPRGPASARNGSGATSAGSTRPRDAILASTPSIAADIARAWPDPAAPMGTRRRSRRVFRRGAPSIRRSRAARTDPALRRPGRGGEEYRGVPRDAGGGHQGGGRRRPGARGARRALSRRAFPRPAVRRGARRRLSPPPTCWSSRAAPTRSGW